MAATMEMHVILGFFFLGKKKIGVTLECLLACMLDKIIMVERIVSRYAERFFEKLSSSLRYFHIKVLRIHNAE